MNELGIEEYEDKDLQIIHYASMAVSKRAGYVCVALRSGCTRASVKIASVYSKFILLAWRVACACSYLAGLGLAVLVKRIFANAPRPLPPLASAGAEDAKEGKAKEKENEKKEKEASKSESKQQQAASDAPNNNQVSVVPPSGVIGLGIDGSLFRYHPRLCATLID